MPLPEAPLGIVSQAALLDAVHVQPEPAVTATATLPLPAAAGKEAVAGLMLNVQAGPALVVKDHWPEYGLWRTGLASASYACTCQ